MLNHFCKGRKWFLVIVAGALGNSAQHKRIRTRQLDNACTCSPSLRRHDRGRCWQVIVGAYGFSSTLGGNTNQLGCITSARTHGARGRSPFTSSR